MNAAPAAADNPMRAQVLSLPELLASAHAELEAATRALLPNAEVFAVRQVIVTGCGDSHAAGALAAAAWTQLTGIDCRPLSALQAARFETEAPRRRFPHDPLVLAVSASGEVARTVEAVEQWRSRGALTVAVTADPRSSVARAAARCLPLPLPPFPAAPGVRSFFLCAQALYLLSIRVGEVRGRLRQEEAARLRCQLAQTGRAIGRMLPALDRTLAALARRWRGHGRYELLAAGPARAAAAYGSAKLLEAAGVPALDQDLEEWLHLQYFARDPAGCATWVICPPPGRDRSRVAEIEPILKRLERPYRIVTGAALGEGLQRTIILPDPPHALFAPFLYAAAPALFAAWLSAEQGAEYGRGARGRWRDCLDGATTRGSRRLPVTAGGPAEGRRAGEARA